MGVSSVHGLWRHRARGPALTLFAREPPSAAPEWRDAAKKPVREPKPALSGTERPLVPARLTGRPGRLQRHLLSGEFDQLQHLPIFESNFVQILTSDPWPQVTRLGEVTNKVTYGGGSLQSSAGTPRPVAAGGPCKGEWTPAAVQPLAAQVKFRTRRAFYLQLRAPRETRDREFGQWVRLLHRLRFPSAQEARPFTQEGKTRARRI
ncbi:hypothetical protein MC885_019729 [Smutsia gigantea]|nr:hypothetical protein MC885_019729 [Smutsia gigantea]